jgi:Holliday junction resolvase RusA-like endonuclease
MFGSHFHERGKVKKAVELALTRLFRTSLEKVVGYPVDFYFVWRNRTRRVDPDNQASAGQKLILDALQKAGVMENDGTYHVGRLYHDFEYGVEEAGVSIELVERVYNDDRLKSVGKGDNITMRKRAPSGNGRKKKRGLGKQLELFDID